MKKLRWFERKFQFGLPDGMLPFYLERLEGTIARLQAKVDGMSEEILSCKFEDKWSVKQNIGHLAEVDQISGIRIGEMVRGLPVLSPAVFEPKGDYNANPIRSLLIFFKENRIANISRFASLNEKELSMTSTHPRLAMPMTPVDLAWFDAEHDDHHLVRINEIIEKLSK